MITKLTEKVLHYLRSGEGLDDLVREVAWTVYIYPRKRLRWNQDDSGDFFLYFYPKIPDLIKRYRYNGKAFEVFLAQTLRYSTRTFAIRRGNKRKYETLVTTKVYWETGEQQVPEAYAAESSNKKSSPTLIPEARSFFCADENGRITDQTAKKRLIYLTLSSSMDITYPFIEAVAKTIDYDPEWLFLCIEKLKARLLSRKKRVKTLQSRKNYALVRIYQLHAEISNCTEEKQRKFMTKMLRREKTRMITAKEEVYKIRFSPTHQDISEVLDIPKGSVDSGMHYIKNALKHLIDEV